MHAVTLVGYSPSTCFIYVAWRLSNHVQVDSPAQPPLQQPSADVGDADNPNFGMPFMNSQPHAFPIQPRCSSSASPQMQQSPDPQMPQQGSFSPQLQSPQMPFPLLQPSHSQQRMPSMASQFNSQQHDQLQQQRQQQQQHIERLEHQIHLQQSRQQMQHMQQQGSGQRNGLPRSASVNHLGMSMQWQPSQGNIGPRCASTSNLMLPGVLHHSPTCLWPEMLLVLVFDHMQTGEPFQDRFKIDGAWPPCDQAGDIILSIRAWICC